MRQWHAILGLVTGIPKHDSLVSSADIEIILANMNSSSNVRTLLVDTHQDFASLVTQALAVNAGEVIDIGVETNLRYNSPNCLLVVDLGLGRDLPCHHHHVILGCSLACHFALRILG